MNSSDIKGVEFVAYQLKGIAYQWCDEWEKHRGNNDEPTTWEDFSKAFLDQLFHQELRKAKAKEFLNLNQEKISV